MDSSALWAIASILAGFCTWSVIVYSARGALANATEELLRVVISSLKDELKREQEARKNLEDAAKDYEKDRQLLDAARAEPDPHKRRRLLLGEDVPGTDPAKLATGSTAGPNTGSPTKGT